MPYPDFTKEEIEKWREEDISRDFLPEDVALDEMRAEEDWKKKKELEEKQRQEFVIAKAKADKEDARQREERLAHWKDVSVNLEAWFEAGRLLIKKEFPDFEFEKLRNSFLFEMQKTRMNDSDQVKRYDTSVNNISAWKTIKLGTHKNVEGARRAFEAAGCRVSDRANEILVRISFSSTEKEVDLVVRSVAELGFANGATLRDIYRRATELGLTLCLAEVGPALREQYCDQILGEWLIVGMEPVADSDGDLGGFVVARSDGGLWLHGSYGSPGDFWFAYIRFVFVSGKCS